MTYSQGPYLPTVAANDSSVGNDYPWSSVDNVKAQDNQYANVHISAHDAETTYYAKATGYGFSIPLGATITGIELTVYRYANRDSSGQYTNDQSVKLVKNGAAVGTSAAKAAHWELTNTAVVYGGSTDLWGTTWTGAEINSANFGAAFQANLVSNNYTQNAYVDSMAIKVYYDNPAPTTPTGLTRANLDATEANTLTWTFNDPMAGDTQSAYQLLAYDASDNSLDYDTGKTISNISANEMAANTLVNGKQYQWKVRTWDSDDQVGPYSSLATFYSSAKPVQTITYPAVDADIVGTSSLRTTWTFTDDGTQSAYKAELLDAFDIVLENSGITTSSNKYHDFAYLLETSTDYKVRVTTWDDKNVASAAVTRTFTVTYTPPPTPTIAVTTDTTRGSITLTITNPTPTGAQPALDYNSIYRKKSSESTYTRIATNIASGGSFTDYTPASGVAYDYLVRAVGENEGYKDSAASRQSITIKNSQLALVSDYNQYIPLVYNASRADNSNYNRTLTKYAGRETAVAEFEVQTDVNLPLSFTVKTAADVQTLREMFEEKDILLYRDQRGRREFVTVGSFGANDQFRPGYYVVSFTLDRTYYSEVV